MRLDSVTSLADLCAKPHLFIVTTGKWHKRAEWQKRFRHVPRSERSKRVSRAMVDYESRLETLDNYLMEIVNTTPGGEDEPLSEEQFAAAEKEVARIVPEAVCVRGENALIAAVNKGFYEDGDIDSLPSICRRGIWRFNGYYV
jgi:hypothetical protein